MEQLVVGLSDLQGIGCFSSFDVLSFDYEFIYVNNVHLNVIHSEEEGVLHPPVFAGLWSVRNDIDLCTEDAISMNSKMKRSPCGRVEISFTESFPKANNNNKT